MDPATKADLAYAILLWRYVGHRATVKDLGDSRPYRALKLAKDAGVRDEYLRIMLGNPILSVKVLGE